MYSFTKKTAKKPKSNKGAEVVRFHRLKISLALILGLIGGACWYYTITSTTKALAAVIEQNTGSKVYDNTSARKKEAEKEETKAIEPIDCYTAAEKYGKEYNVDTELLKRIIKAESGNNNNAENPLSTAKGCFQFISSTWKHYSQQLWGVERYKKNPFSYTDNTELAAFVLSKYGINKARAEWAESAYKWDK